MLIAVKLAIGLGGGLAGDLSYANILMSLVHAATDASRAVSGSQRG